MNISIDIGSYAGCIRVVDGWERVLVSNDPDDLEVIGALAQLVVDILDDMES